MTRIAQSSHFAIYQDDKRSFIFKTPHKTVRLTCCQLLSLRTKIKNMDLAAHFDENRNRHGLEILTFCNREHLLILNTYEVIDLKKLMDAVFEKLTHSVRTMHSV